MEVMKTEVPSHVIKKRYLDAERCHDRGFGCGTMRRAPLELWQPRLRIRASSAEPGMRNHGHHKMPSVDDQVKRMTKKLNLNEDQQSKVRDILDNQRGQMEQLRSDTSLSQAMIASARCVNSTRTAMVRSERRSMTINRRSSMKCREASETNEAAWSVKRAGRPTATSATSVGKKASELIRVRVTGGRLRCSELVVFGQKVSPAPALTCWQLASMPD